MFIHENGNIYTKSELNKDLSYLLSTYPDLETARDSWSGHSFRSGLTTVLSLLGFSEDEIKSWGRSISKYQAKLSNFRNSFIRWASEAFKIYIKDQSQRRAVRAKLTKTFDSILNFI